MEALSPITKPKCRTAPSVSPPSCETTRCGTRKPRVDARSRRTQRKELSRRETRADPTRERDLMAPAKKSGTRASARVRKPPSVAGDFEYGVERPALRPRGKKKVVGAKKAARGARCACGKPDCGRVSYKGNYREDCEYRKEHGLEVDASGKRAEYDSEYYARPEVIARRADPFGGHQAYVAAQGAERYLATLEARREHKRWKKSLPKKQRKVVEEAEAAIKAAKDAESDRWALGKLDANDICASLAKSNPALAHIFGREWVATRLICADGEWAKSATRAQALGALLFHGTNVAPDRLEPVGGEPFMLRPSRKPHQRGRTAFVYGSLSNDPSLPISFVEVHNGKRFVSLAREQPASNAVYLYILDQRHARPVDRAHVSSL